MKARKEPERKNKELLGLGCCFGGIILLVCLLSYHPSDPTVFNASKVTGRVHNVLGLFGAHIAYILVRWFGIAATLIPIGFIWKGYRTIVPPTTPHNFSRGARIATSLLFFLVCLLIPGLLYPIIKLHGIEVATSGIIGTFLTTYLESAFSRTGAIIVVTGLFFLALFALIPTSVEECIIGFTRAVVGVCYGFIALLCDLVRKIFRIVEAVASRIREIIIKQPTKGNNKRSASKEFSNNASSESIEEYIAQDEGDTEIVELQALVINDEKLFSSDLVIVPQDKQQKSTENQIKSETHRDRREFKSVKNAGSSKDFTFTLPQVDFLKQYDLPNGEEDEHVLLQKAEVLRQKLADFGIQGEVTAIHPGPVVTMFEYVPAPGIKISRIVNLQNDLTMALKALSVRIVAPIPGKAAVGIEIPNKKRQLVPIREIIDSEAFRKATAPLTITLGKDIVGEPAVTNLARMPHLLIAGATGTGKSVCLNAILTSLLFRNPPSVLRLLLIDPKRIELSFYEDIPHLIHPVVKDAKKANQALKWAVSEMESRYELMAEMNARNIEGYNQAVRKLRQGTNGEVKPDYECMPYIVIVIDELADLMVVASRDVEESITRLAQMARAAGIHLILATQRPSVDVITGLIKANIPCRISFQVSSKIDSRTILDSSGAETLLGSGDMLFVPPGTAKLQRIHGAFISEEEVRRVAAFWKTQAQELQWEHEYVSIEDSQTSPEFDESEADEKYEEAVRIVLQTRQASISMLQRRLRVGYNRAARMIEMMEQQGIVGPSDGIKPREVLLPPISDIDSG